MLKKNQKIHSQHFENDTSHLLIILGFYKAMGKQNAHSHMYIFLLDSEGHCLKNNLLDSDETSLHVE